MSKRSFGQLPRWVEDHWMARDPLALWLYAILVLRASHQDRQWIYMGEVFSLKRGQLLISIHELAATVRPKISWKPLSKRLNMFETEKIIVQERSRRGTVITICNYNGDSACEDSEGNTEGTTEVAQKSNQGNAEVAQKSANKKVRIKEGNNDSTKHPSPNAPAHLRRKAEELKPFPDEDGPVWLTDEEYQEFCKRWSIAETEFLIRAMVRWESANEKKFKSRKDHALTLINFRNHELGGGKIFFEHPSTGPNYYKTYEVERWAK